MFFGQNKLLDPENPQFAVFGIKIGQEVAEKELLVKKRDSGPVCNGLIYYDLITFFLIRSNNFSV